MFSVGYVFLRHSMDFQFEYHGCQDMHLLTYSVKELVFQRFVALYVVNLADVYLMFSVGYLMFLMGGMDFQGPFV